VNKFTGYEEERILPENRDGLSDDMGQYFDSKIMGIRKEIESRQKLIDESKVASLPSALKCQKSLSTFEAVNKEELQIIMSEVTNKTCSLDPVPTNIIKKCFDELYPITLKIINDSLSTGLFPSTLKQSIVKPKIKDKNGDPEDFTNYIKVLNNLSPHYLSDLLRISIPRRNGLRSSNDFALVETSHCSKSISFQMCKQWNLLPYALRSISCLKDFKVKLKTYYFDSAFHD